MQSCQLERAAGVKGDMNEKEIDGQQTTFIVIAAIALPVCSIGGVMVMSLAFDLMRKPSTAKFIIGLAILGLVAGALIAIGSYLVLRGIKVFTAEKEKTWRFDQEPPSYHTDSRHGNQPPNNRP
jgi:multisubunit Na+/H+ antiporter MnhC subunit